MNGSSRELHGRVRASARVRFGLSDEARSKCGDPLMASGMGSKWRSSCSASPSSPTPVFLMSFCLRRPVIAGRADADRAAITLSFMVLRWSPLSHSAGARAAALVMRPITIARRRTPGQGEAARAERCLHGARGATAGTRLMVSVNGRSWRYGFPADVRDQIPHGSRNEY